MTWGLNRPAGMRTVVRSRTGTVHLAQAWSAFAGTTAACGRSFDEVGYEHMVPAEVADACTCRPCAKIAKRRFG